VRGLGPLNSDRWAPKCYGYVHNKLVSPTVFRAGPFRFYFFSREERRMHIHVDSPDGEAKFWMEPEIQLARNHRFSEQDLARIRRLVEEHENVIRTSWHEHFGS
jgi:hypothetical protein